VKFNSSVFVVS